VTDDSHNTVLSVRGLGVSARDRRRGLSPIVSDISFTIRAGRVTALIGESGSGKTTIALACLGYTRAGCQVVSGEVILNDRNILDLPYAERRLLRGREVAYIAQSAAAAFNGALTINRQVIETAVTSAGLSKGQALQKAESLYAELDLPDHQHIGTRYPHQVSGGQLQRLMAAMAMMCDPALLILDEPTTALDVTTQIEVLKSFRKLIRDKHTSAIYVSHDLAVVAQVADDVLVLKDGIVVESGPVQQIIESPQHAYTKALIAAAHVMPEELPAPRTITADENVDAPLLRVQNVTAGYGRRHQHLALRDVSIEVEAGRTLGVIGESGSGKTSLARVVSGLMSVKEGTVELLGERLADSVQLRDRETQRHIQFAFQMADVALNPRHSIGKILRRPVQFYFDLDTASATQRVIELLGLVELPAHYIDRYPRQLSGGERQRVNLARALAAEPKLIICDEITSALDTVVAKAVLKLLKDLQQKLNVGYLFISHDLSVIAEVADTISVMREGRVVQSGIASQVMSPPFHPYTELLLNSVPQMRTTWLDDHLAAQPD
jgi:peptide/nickel transport system ATP-binding protein